MRAALDKLRSVLVALTCDQHSSAWLLREALADLEREHATRRAPGADDFSRCACGVPSICGDVRAHGLCAAPEFRLAQFRDDLVEHVPDPSPPTRD